VIKALENLSESALANLFDYLEAEPNLIILRYAIVPVGVIIAVVNDPLSLGRVYLELVRCKIEYFFEFLYLRDLGLSQELTVALGGLCGCNRVLDAAVPGLAHVLDSELLPLGCLGYDLTLLLGRSLLTAISSGLVTVLLVTFITWLLGQGRLGRGRRRLLLWHRSIRGLVRVLQGEVPPTLSCPTGCLGVLLLLLLLDLLGIIGRYLILRNTCVYNIRCHLLLI
jgi:hypothetical protein